MSERAVPHRVSVEEHFDVVSFLDHEAALADAWQLFEWLELLTDDVQYRAPVRTTRERNDVRATSMPLFDEDHAMLHLRVRRYLEVDSAWSESPWSRVRRFVTNVRVVPADGGYRATSNLLLLRSRLDSDQYQFVSAERIDHLVRLDDGTLKLRSRDITIDQSRLGMPNLPFPL